MLEFKPITIDARDQMLRYMSPLTLGTTESTFTDLFLWAEHYKNEFCVKDGFLFIRSGDKFLTPYGEGDLKAAIDLLPYDATFICVSEGNVRKITEIYPNRFEIREMRDSFDYIYRSEDMILLQGKKLHPKRTNVNKFTKNYEYEFVEISSENLDEVRSFQAFWFEKNVNDENRESLEGENRAIERAFSNFDALNLKCGAIKIEGKIAAYSYGVPINDKVFLICVEKADTAYSGIYQVINRDFAARFCKDFEFINREEDLGDEGLRRAKLSYNPAYLARKFMLVSR
ncbi:MAG: DUF2156 domain-containing protein [Clostridia bacterium]|nr:DUF2156 domain-containing protein [Clostridia bacterium]